MSMNRRSEASLFARIVESAAGPNMLSNIVEKWSPQARAAAAAARGAKKGGQDWRKAARTVYKQQPGRGGPADERRGGPELDYHTAQRTGASTVDPAVRRASKLASKVGKEPTTMGSYTTPAGRAYSAKYNDTVNKSYRRRKARFSGF
jgi:hypothetical protein